MKKLLVWGYALQSMDKVEKMGLPRVSSGVLGISEVFNPKKTHPDFDFPWSWFVKGQEIPPMPEKVYVCLKKARGVTFDFLPYNDFFIMSVRFLEFIKKYGFDYDFGMSKAIIVNTKLTYSIQNDKSIKVKSSAISSLGHLFKKYNLGEEEFRTIENNISSIWNINRYSIIISIAFSSAYFPKRNYIKEYLIKNLNSKHHKIISWVLYGLKGKHYKSESIENLLIHKLSQFNEKSYIYNEIIAFLISISSKKVIPYIEKTLFTQSKIDDEIYTELKNNLSDEFAELRKKLLEEFK